MNAIKQRQKLRVIVNGFSIYATARQVRMGLGDCTRSNSAVQQALASLDRMQSDKIPPCGLAGSWNNMNVQVDFVN